MRTASKVINHPKYSAEENAIGKFRHAYVDLDISITRQGRGLRDLIIKQIEDKSGVNGFPLIIKSQSFGAGSFGRNTICKPLDDIDIYVVLNSGGVTMSHEGRQYLLAGDTSGSFNTDPNLRYGEWISADLVLQRVTNHLRSLPVVQEYYGQVGTNSKRRGAYIKFGDLNVDINPVLWARFEGAIDRFYMPEGNGSYSWKPTNPKEDQRRLGQ